MAYDCCVLFPQYEGGTASVEWLKRVAMVQSEHPSAPRDQYPHIPPLSRLWGGV